jgi:multidrug resistance efflux pump
VEGNIKLALEYAEAMSQRRREIHARQSAERDLEHAEHDLRETEARIKGLSADIEESEAKRIEASRLLDAIDPDKKSSQGKPKTEEGKRIFEERCYIEQHIAQVSSDMKGVQSRLLGKVKSRDQLRQKLGLPVSDPEKVESPDNPAVSC